MHRLDLGLYSHPKEFWGNGFRTHVNSKGKILCTGKKKSPQRRIEPTTLHQAGQRAQHTTNELFWPPSNANYSTEGDDKVRVAARHSACHVQSCTSSQYVSSCIPSRFCYLPVLQLVVLVSVYCKWVKKKSQFDLQRLSQNGSMSNRLSRFVPVIHCH